MNDAVSANVRLRDVKRSALVACVAALLGLAVPMWNFTNQMLALESNIDKLGGIAVILVGFVFTATVPLFYFALYRAEGDLPVSRNLRWLTLASAVVIGILGVAPIRGWIASLWRDSVWRPWTLADISTLLNLIANLAGILLLVTLFRLAGDGSSEGGFAGSNVLRLFTKIAVIAGVIVAAGCVIGLAATPWAYSNIRSLEAGSSNASLTFWGFALDRARAALSAISVYVAPFVVWQGRRTQAVKH